MRCGLRGEHCTERCVSSSPAVQLPPLDDRPANSCLWCAVRGHTWEKCWKRLPQAVTDLDSEVKGLKSPSGAIGKAIADVENISKNMDKIAGEVRDLQTWKAKTDDRLDALENNKTDVAEWRAKISADVTWAVARGKNFNDFLRNDWPRLSGGNKRSNSADERTAPKRPKVSWLELPPAAEPPWTEPLFDCLWVDWSPEKYHRLRDWGKKWLTSEMFETIVVIDALQTADDRKRALFTVVDRANVPPGIFMTEERG